MAKEHVDDSDTDKQTTGTLALKAVWLEAPTRQAGNQLQPPFIMAMTLDDIYSIQ